MNPARFERDLARARARYARATQRFDRAMTDWEVAAVPIAMIDETVPFWTPHQRDVTGRAVKAWDDLLTCHQVWDGLLHDLGRQR